MNWAKENPFLTGFLVVSVLVIGGLGYFAYSQYATHTELLSSYETEVGKLHSLQNQTPFPNAENLKKMIDSRQQYQAALVALGKSLETRELPLKGGITPQQFQDELRKAVSNAEKLAATAGMSLPKSFYLGFDTYSANLPSQEAAPHLAQELKAIEAIFAGLTEARVENLSELTRAPLAVEEGNRPASRNGPNAAAAPKLIERNYLDLTFMGEQGRVRLAINSLLSSPQFALIRSVKIQNSSPLSPPVTTEAAPSTTPSTPEFSSAEIPNNPRALNMVFGREKITAQVRVELLSFEKIAESGDQKPR